ncbi:hypothetical protein GQ42DRAFT_46651 [Ramicandelaber brevisporus]|nr:hypothetical protein GQ42DRAFT_46651 [Ramicandelaber brevisporus]
MDISDVVKVSITHNGETGAVCGGDSSSSQSLCNVPVSHSSDIDVIAGYVGSCSSAFATSMFSAGSKRKPVQSSVSIATRSISATAGYIVWDAFISIEDGNVNCLNAHLPSSVNHLSSDEFRDQIVVLIELAEMLECSRLYIAVDRNDPSVSSLVRALMYLGFYVVPPVQLGIASPPLPPQGQNQNSKLLQQSAFIILCQDSI